MNTETCSDIIASFLEVNYSDEDLCLILAFAEDGKLVYNSCCCLIGIPTANHRLRGKRSQIKCILGLQEATLGDHLRVARKTLLGAYDAECAFLEIAKTDRERRRLLIPIVKKEIARRAEARWFRELNARVAVIEGELVW